jgi:SAM-dependent methyltransferase
MKFGHTGWSDFAIYYYDQILRIKAVRETVNRNCTRRNLALDYGCGTGNFSFMLSEYFHKVIGVDISELIVNMAKGANKKNNISFELTSDLIFEYQYDVILSITVLQHITDDHQLTRLITQFERSLNKDGILVVLESFSGAGSDSEHIKLRRMDDFVEMFRIRGLSLLCKHDFYHPSHFPTEQFRRYNSNCIVKFTNKLHLLGFPYTDCFLKRIAQKMVKNDNGIIGLDSFTKLMVFGHTS